MKKKLIINYAVFSITVAFQLVIPPNRANGANEYPMFVFCDGYICDSQLTPKRFPLPEMQYSTDGQENDFIDTEEFEVL